MKVPIRSTPTGVTATGSGVSRPTFAPVHLLVAAAVSALVVTLSGPANDLELFWHVMSGQEILRHATLHTGGDWSYTRSAADWRTTQWASEAVMAALSHLGGLNLVLVACTTAVAAALAVLATVTLRGAGSAEGRALAFGVAAFAAVPGLYTRPTLAAFLLLPIAGLWMLRLSRGQPWPHPSLMVGATWLLANFHGYWVLVPTAVVAGTVARWVSARTVASLRSLGWAVACLLAGALTPYGPGLLGAPLTFQAATRDYIIEWRPPHLWSHYAVPVEVMLALVVLAWSSRRASVGAAEVLLVTGWSAFAFVAARNCSTAAVLLAPLVADRLAVTLPSRAPGSSRERRVIMLGCAGILLLGLGAGVLRSATVEPHGPGAPLTIARSLAASSSPERVVEDYNLAGLLLSTGYPHVQVAVDGRTDLFGHKFLGDYFGLIAANPGWEESLRRFAPTAVVLRHEDGLLPALLDKGWSTQLTDGDYVLLRPVGYRGS